MKLLSVNVGLPREIAWNDKTIRTSIFKSSVTSRVRVARLNLAGDEQSDLTVHGGRDKAVYVYPSEHYPFWRQEFPDLELLPGAFGENFTTEGLLEGTVGIGDRFRVGSAEFVVTQPRMPCFKLGLRFKRPEIVRRFLQSGRTGFYLAVMEEGEVGAGDAISLLARDEPGVTVADVVKMYKAEETNPELLRDLSELPALPESWRAHFRKRLSN